MLLLNRKAIEQVITMKEVIEGVKTAFQMVVRNEVDVPLRTVMSVPGERGSFLIMPCYADSLNTAGVKLAAVFPGNIEKGLASATGQILLADGDTGHITAILDGTYITQLRTGASSGAAFDVLGKKNCTKGGMIGTGGQAATQLEAMIAVRSLKEVLVFDLNKARREKFCMEMQEKLGHYGTRIRPAKSADEAVCDADLFITVTPSPVPVFDGTKVKKGATISCVGIYEPTKHELDPAVLPRASKIFCDSKEAALAETGDLLIPIQQGIITEDDVLGSLGSVISGSLTGRENDDEIIVYETVGVAAQDLVVSKMIYDKAVKMDVGIEWR